ncbi:MAG: HAMP domain-containing histidine kinase [Actinobacteria bacterium]|nr:HAMP domain-containing histidine kinase [Actinomycetota bacterium]
MSLRGRLLLAVGAVALVALVVADVATYSALHSFLYQRVDQTLDSAHRILESGVDVRGGGIYYEVRDDAGNVLRHGGAGRFGAEYTPKLPSRISGLSGGAASTAFGPGPGGGGPEARRHLVVGSAESGGPRFRVLATSLAGGGQLIVATPLNEVSGTLHRLFRIELAVTLAALVGAGLLGWSLVRVGLGPLEEVEATASAIAEGELDRRVPGEDASTEIGRLARTLNIMLGKIQDAFSARDATEARLRRFVADASHELRTPLAAVSAYAELFDRGARDNPEDLSRAMSGIRTETARMGGLVEDLLLLVRMDEGRPFEQKPVELVALAAEAVDAARAMGPAWTVNLVAAESVEVVGDRGRLRQVFDNLLSNVRAHTPPGTVASVYVRREDDRAVIEVSDDGPGMSAEQASRAFERFYRADPSRSRLHGGAGLGLAIVAAIVETHGGTVEASSPPGGGATFTARLPITSTPVLAPETGPIATESGARSEEALATPAVETSPANPPEESAAPAEPEAAEEAVLPDPSRSAGSPPG